jgi:argininosuccinate lyase
MKVKQDNMRSAAQRGFINATDLADYLVTKGMPFRQAYKISGALVARCLETGQILETLPLEEYQAVSGLFEEDLYQAVDLDQAVNRRSSKGGTSSDSVKQQTVWFDQLLQKMKEESE